MEQTEELQLEQALAYVHGLTRFGSQLGLERMRALLALLGDPHKQCRFVHIAGTNGKGSTAAMTAKIVQLAGYKTGLYISPFVIDFRERFQINGEMIAKAELLRIFEQVKQAADELAQQQERVTEFEFVTAIGFTYFCQNHCDLVCLEVGLGGRFDATNVIDTPLVAAITSISLDHTAILGDTIAKIAFEKAGIVKENGTVVCYPLQPEEAIAVILEKAAATGSKVILPNRSAIKEESCSIDGSVYRYGDTEYQVTLAGQHQIYNSVVVLEVVKVLREKGYVISEEAVKAGLWETFFPARFEIMNRSPLVVVDGGHNRDGARMLSDMIGRIPAKKKEIIMGILADKDHQGAVELIGGVADAVIAVPVSNPRSLPMEVLAQEMSAFCKEVTYTADLKQAFEQAMDFACKEQGAVVICGSLYLASEMREIVKRYFAPKS